jgi:hypothetical protein
MISQSASEARPASAPPDETGERHAELRAVAAAVNARMRANVVRLGPAPSAARAVVTSGFPALDAATGLGGFPCGRITELIGQPTAGRETVAARTVAAAGGVSAWVDVPGLVDVDQLARSGVDLARLFLLRPRQPIDALGIAAQAISSGNFRVVVLDALADLASGAETSMAVAQFVRVVVPALGRTTAAALVLSAPEQRFRPLAHAAALRIALVKVGLIRQGGVFRGWRTQASVLKSPGLQGGESGFEVWL